MERKKFILDTPGQLHREPIACSLDGHGFRQRLDEFRAAFGRGYLAGERTATGVRWRFRAAPGLEEDLRSLAGRERECCRFFIFEIQTVGYEIWWDAGSRIRTRCLCSRSCSAWPDPGDRRPRLTTHKPSLLIGHAEHGGREQDLPGAGGPQPPGDLRVADARRSGGEGPHGALRHLAAGGLAAPRHPKDAGLVNGRREGRCVYYRVEPRGMKPLIDWIAHYRAFWTEHVDRLEQLLEKMDE